MRRASRHLRLLYEIAARIAALRPARPDADDLARHDRPATGPGRRLRMGERLRDAWRPRWLRLKRSD